VSLATTTKKNKDLKEKRDLRAIDKEGYIMDAYFFPHIIFNRWFL
jgi:hypothetical protein